ncbi:MAG: OmpA family protein [Thermoanaerobaculia bacterium]|nr:OmpA family protein [Thermoanaerobaculia bacterium]
MKLTPLAKAIIAIAILATAFFSIKRFAPGLLEKIVPAAKTKESQVPPKADLPAAPDGSQAGTPSAPVSLPGSEPGCTDKTEVRFYVWAWNSQMGGMLANGGPQAAQGSLMCANGVNLRFIREDMVDKMQEGLVAFATELSKGNAQPKNGVHFVAIMGDGSATFLKGVNDTLKKIGKDYQAKVVGSMGYSRGEDKFMGLPAWKQNPQAARGGLVAGYLRDGDWNIALKWLGDNGICNNPDEKTWDPNCLNWVAANDYIDAGEKYIAGYCEDRPVVEKGKKTGATKKVCVNGVVTWTPGDVNVAMKKGGLVSIVSTKEYSSQMPNTIIGIDKWMKANRPVVEGMLSAIFQAGDQIKSNPQALRKAAEISAVVYKEQDAAYWEKYFKGVTERDKQGLMVELGGSSVNNLADNLLLFGLTQGSQNLFAATYRVFGDIVVQQYPELVPNYPPVTEVLDTSYIQALAARQAPTTQAEVPKFEQAAKVTNVVSRRSWQINFESGKAAFSPDAYRNLDQLLNDLLVASATVVEVHGHTDSQGNPDKNMQLSEERAFAVKQWLEQKAPVNFPSGRIRVFAHGQTNPVAPNSTETGRAQNRRVEIVIGTTGG